MPFHLINYYQYIKQNLSSIEIVIYLYEIEFRIYKGVYEYYLYKLKAEKFTQQETER